MWRGNFALATQAVLFSAYQLHRHPCLSSRNSPPHSTTTTCVPTTMQVSSLPICLRLPRLSQSLCRSLPRSRCRSLPRSLCRSLPLLLRLSTPSVSSRYRFQNCSRTNMFTQCTLTGNWRVIRSSGTRKQRMHCIKRTFGLPAR